MARSKRTRSALWIKGERYVRYKLVSDLACINSVEVLPWEGWGICAEIAEDALSQEDVALLDEIARILVASSLMRGSFRARLSFLARIRGWRCRWIMGRII